MLAFVATVIFLSAAHGLYVGIRARHVAFDRRALHDHIAGTRVVRAAR